MQAIIDSSDPYYSGMYPPNRNDYDILVLCAESDMPDPIQKKYPALFTRQNAVTSFGPDDFAEFDIMRDQIFMMQRMNMRRVEMLQDFDFSERDQVSWASKSLISQSRDGRLIEAVTSQKVETVNHDKTQQRKNLIAELFNNSRSGEAQRA